MIGPVALIAEWILPGVGGRLWLAKLLAWVLFLLAVAAIGGLGKCAYDANLIGGHEAKTSAKLERTGRQADTSAAQRAQARRRAEDQARKEFDDATAGIPDNGLSDRQRLDICRELHDAGTDTSVIPECRDAGAGGEARP